jgi:hypothetical protein
MDGLTIILLWILLSFPIVRMVNRKMEQNNEDTRFKTGFQIYLFIRAQFEVPRYYLFQLIKLLK